MPQYYTPFLAQAGRDIGRGLEARGVRQQKTYQNKLAGDAYMGDPQAIQELMQVNPTLGIQIQEGARKRKEASEQKALDKATAEQEAVVEKRKRFTSERDSVMENIAKFNSFEEAKEYGDSMVKDLGERYPEIMTQVGDDEVFDEKDFQLAKQIHADKPASVRGVSTTLQEMKYLESIKDPKERTKKEALMKELKGRNKIVTIAGVPHMVLPDQTAVPLGTEEAEVEFKEAEAKAKKAGAITGEVETIAKIDLPKIKSDAEYLKSVVRSALDHPGFKSVVGMPSLGKLTKYVGGTEEAAFHSVHKQITGKTFMEAYKTLKGGGQITEVEGQKATEALQRLDTALSEKEYIAAAEEFISEIDRLTALAEQRSTGGTSPVREFSSVEEATAANLPPGTKITVGGRSAIVE
jgi:hypothetical protein